LKGIFSQTRTIRLGNFEGQGKRKLGQKEGKHGRVTFKVGKIRIQFSAKEAAVSEAPPGQGKGVVRTERTSVSSKRLANGWKDTEQRQQRITWKTFDEKKERLIERVFGEDRKRHRRVIQ